MKQILKDAYKSSELHHHITEVIAVDDKCEPEDIPESFIISEAEYVLSKYIGGIGFEHEEEYNGHRGDEAQKDAKQNVKAIKAFLKKYSNKD
jgi:hypothetical protein